MNAKETVRDRYMTFQEGLSRIEALIDTGQLEEALNLANLIAYQAWTQHCGLFASHTLEVLLGRISAMLPNPPDQRTVAARRRVLTIMSSAHAYGGHSRIAWRWIKIDEHSEHTLVLTLQQNNPLPAQLLELEQQGILTIVRLDNPSWCARVEALRVQLAHADQVVLLTRPDDVVPCAALPGMENPPPTIFVDHASHVFWLGVTIANVVLNTATVILEKRRGIPKEHIGWALLPMDFSYLDKPAAFDARARFGIPAGAPFLLSCGSSFKYWPIEGVSLAAMVEPIMARHDQAHLLVVGVTPTYFWDALAKRFPGRVHLQGYLLEAELVACYQACDIYLDSLPISSPTTLLEVAALGKPIVRYAQADWRGTGFSLEFDCIPTSFYLWTTHASYENDVSRLITDQAFRAWRGRFGQTAVRLYYADETFRHTLDVIYEMASGLPTIPSRPDADCFVFDRLDQLLNDLTHNQFLLTNGASVPPLQPYELLIKSARLTTAHPLVNRLIAESHNIHISVIITSSDNPQQLDETLASVSAQIRTADTVNIISACNPMEPPPNGDNAHWTLLLREGDALENDCLLLLERALQRNGTKDTLFVYFDHDEINEHGQFDCPHLKPDFNHDLLLSYPYIGRAVLVRTAWLAHCLSTAEAPQASLPLAYWLALRALTEGGAPAFLHLPAIVAHMAAAEPAVFASTTECWQQLAGILAAHLATAAPGAQIVEGPGPGTFKVVYPLEQTPLVTIVIPTRDQVALLSRCIVSIFQSTNYPSYEIIVVDNDSQTVEAKEFLAGLNQIESGQVRVLRAPGKFNFSRMNNLAAKEARGDFLLLLNNDTAVSQPDWLSHLVRNALRENVGVVGARLLYPDETLQHVGVILGLRGPADHPCIGIPADGAGYLYRAQVQQDFSAVTAACLLVSKSLYLELGGLDETSFAVSYNDVDFCLRVRQTGRRVVWTPLATLLHEGSASQKNNVEGTSENNKLARFASERAAMYARWPEQIANDPAFNPNLSLRKLGYELEETNPLLRFDRLQGLTAHRVLALPSDADGCGQYRVLQPMQAMLEAGLCTGGASREVFTPNLVLRSGADTLVVQRVDNDFGLEFLESMRPLKGVKKIYEVDDHPSKVRLSNEAHKLMPKDMRGRVAKAIGLCDRLVVSTPPLARALAQYNGDIRVVPNRLPPAMWGATPPQKMLDQQVAQCKPRIGWAGGIGHAGDLKMVEAVIKEFSDRVDWIFIGVVPDSLRKYLREYHPGVPTLKYPELLMRQNWDLAIAPLELHEFNECKSNLKLLEYGWCGIPVVCSDITPYQCGLPVTRVKNKFKDWHNAIAERIADLEACRRDGLVLQQQIAADWTLKDEHLTEWYKAWTD